MIRVGLVGFGMAGRVFHAPLLHSVEGYELVSVFERTTNRAAERYPAIRTVRSLEELLSDASLDLIVVAATNETHAEMALKALEAGKHVVVDKPMALDSTEIAGIARLSRKKNRIAVPFQNRRWDGDFLTVKKIIAESSLGRLVHLESRMDRWNPGAPRVAWKNDPTQGGILVDLGTHLVDQALALFGKPLGVTAIVTREREGEGANDSFTISLRYEGLRVNVGSNMLTAVPGIRFSLRGTKGGFRKFGIDPQETALNKVMRIESPKWGHEPPEEWGTLHADVEGGMDTERIETVPGDYRQFYIGVKEAIKGNAAPPVTAVDAWRTARVLEWAAESSRERREIACDWTGEPV